MKRLVLYECHRRCNTIRLLKLIRTAKGGGLAENKVVIDELYYGSGKVAVDLPTEVDAENLAVQLRACGTKVDVVA